MYQQKTVSIHGSPVSYYQHYAAASPQKGVVFCHGDGQNHTAGLDILALFPASYAKIGFDRPGHGRSPLLPGRTIADECNVLESILENEGIKEAILVGHSSGAVVATSFALQHDIKALILINPFFMNPRELFGRFKINVLERLYLWKAKGKYNPAAQCYEFGTEKSEEDIHHKAFAGTPHETLRQNLGLFEGYDVREAMRNLSCPVLILQTTQGILSTHQHVSEVCRDLPNVRIENFETKQHNIHLLAKEEVKKSIRKHASFLRI
jgi:pimeloyl-ACP methyl ester carboxylesterase